jgi:glycosyltransferase involved in cell wall biosynthesis
MATTTRPEVSLALPCYNERDNIAEVLRDTVMALDGWGRPWEILVIDNHSSDGTPDAVRAFMAGEPRVRLVVHESNRFYSGSCRTALGECRGRYVAIMDSDGQFSALDLPAMLSLIEGGRANLVFGWRKVRHDPLSRKLMSAVFNGLARFWLGFPLHDLNVGIRIFDEKFRRAAEIRHALNMANPELFVRARLAGLKVAEVPVRHAERTKGQTCHDLSKLTRIFLTVHHYFMSLRGELKAAVAAPVTLPIAAPPAGRRLAG